MSQLAAVFAALALTTSAACAGAVVAGTGTDPQGGLRIHLQCSPHQRALQVVYRIDALDGTLPPEIEFQFPAEWAGAGGFLEDIDDIRVESPPGAAVGAELTPDGLLRFRPDGTGSFSLTYTLRPRQAAPTSATRLRTSFSRDRLFAHGQAFLAQPIGLPSSLTERVTVVVDPSDPTWKVRATVPIDGETTLATLLDSAFFAGDLARHTVAVDGGAVHVFSDRSVGELGETVARLTSEVVAAQRAMLGDELSAQTVVVVLSRTDDPGAHTGAGRAGGFVLELGAGASPSTVELVELIAHENLHRLNGHALRFAASEELSTLWFREGATEYVSLRNAADAGLIPAPRFFQFLGRALAGVVFNPGADAPPSEFERRYWTDGDLRRLPYDRGALITALIDLRLRRSGAGDVEGWLAFMRDDPSTRLLPLTGAALRSALERYSGLSWSEEWSAWVTDGSNLPAFEALQSAGLRVVERLEPAPWHGFRASAGADGRWRITRVDADSPAEQAGLYAGMELARPPLLPASDAHGAAVVEVLTDRGTRLLSVHAGVGQRRAFALVDATERTSSYLAAFGLR